MKSLILTLLLLLASTARADDTFITLPLPSELLKTPIELECGAIIREWRGGVINTARVDSICGIAESRFTPFVQELGYSIQAKPFRYSLSFIPYGRNYRDLNDTQYRFANRNLGNSLTGYTVHEGQYVFNISDINDPDFNVSLMHELFHAMSYYYGVFDQYPGTMEEKLVRDEDLAQKFTKKIMGRK